VPPDDVRLVIDVGCGTGRFTRFLETCFDASAIGVDPSDAMLDRARDKHPEGRYRRAPAEALPLDDAAVDAAFLSMVYHHINDIDGAMAEVHRVLRPGGWLCVRTSTVDRLDDVVYLQHFPEARAVNEVRLPFARDVQHDATRQGFAPIVHEIVHQPMAVTPAAYISQIEKRMLSDLIAIPDEAFETGLQRLKAAVDGANRAQPVSEPIDLFVFRKPATETDTSARTTAARSA
jgi:ubiquinone/menaquinone biosynthesis C-methylase UbiE